MLLLPAGSKIQATVCRLHSRRGWTHFQDSIQFPGAGQKYEATLYADAPDADYKTNPQAYVIRKMKIDHKSKLVQKCAAGGGYAIEIREIKN